MSNEIEQHLTPEVVAAPASQATTIEQRRAVAEVQAMVIVAQQVPRNLDASIRNMREACAQEALAERAFYKYPRAGQQVTGATIHLACELARCFGNVTYGISELRRDDVAGVSEMQAWAWDLQANTRSTQVFIVPHTRDTREGPKALTDSREVYENTANMGARRLREAIFKVLPSWYVEDAKERCTATLAGDSKKPRSQRIVDAIEVFESNYDVTVDQLEAKLGRPKDKWTDHDLAELSVTYKSLQRNEVLLDEVFEPRRVTAAEITGSSTVTAGSLPAAPATTVEVAGGDAPSSPASTPSEPEGEASPVGTEGTSGSGDTGRERAAEGDGEGEPAEAARASQESTSPSPEPDEVPETWQEHAGRLDVKTVDLLRAIKTLWPKNSQWDLPSNRTQIQAAYERDAESAARIHQAIDQAAAKAGDA